MFNKLSFRTKLLSTFILYGLLLSGVAFFTIYSINAINIKENSIKKAKVKAKEETALLYKYIESIHDNLYAINHSKIFRTYLKNKNNYFTTRELFLNIARTSKNIMQIRYIDLQGNEIIRIDRKRYGSIPYYIHSDSLQNKSNRYYFKNILKEQKNKIWHSAIDLNIENGEIQKPYEAVLRAGIPIYENNEKKGILIINIFMNNFFEDFVKSANYNIYLIDKNGYFKAHKYLNYTWGKQRNIEYSIKDEFPQVYNNILNDNEYMGQTVYSVLINHFNKDGMKLVIQPKYYTIQNQLHEHIKELLFTMVVIILLSFPFAYFFARTPTKLKHEVDELNKNLEQKVKQKTKQLQDMNDNLEKRIQIEVNKNSKKDKILFQQNKIASLGEMLGNIAHQWRQPLSAISSSASGIRLQKDMGILEDKDLNDSLDNILQNSKYLSKTIDDFRNYFKQDKQTYLFNLSATINESLNILKPSLKNNEIEVITSMDETIKIQSLKNQLIQVLLNIITNAKDAFLTDLDKIVTKRLIFIKLKQTQDNVVITIKDNAGGIPNDIIEKIFEPYFTTKHKDQGTGIGLYMSQEIIVKHLHGTMTVKNTQFIFDDCKYKGATFVITLPLNK